MKRRHWTIWYWTLPPADTHPASAWLKIPRTCYVGCGVTHQLMLIGSKTSSSSIVFTSRVGTCNEDRPRLYSVRSEDRDINIKHVFDRYCVDILKKRQVTLWPHWVSRGSSKWHPAGYKYTATSNRNHSRTKNNQESSMYNRWKLLFIFTTLRTSAIGPTNIPVYLAVCLYIHDDLP